MKVSGLTNPTTLNLDEVEIEVGGVALISRAKYLIYTFWRGLQYMSSPHTLCMASLSILSIFICSEKVSSAIALWADEMG